MQKLEVVSICFYKIELSLQIPYELEIDRLIYMYLLPTYVFLQ